MKGQRGGEREIRACYRREQVGSEGARGAREAERYERREGGRRKCDEIESGGVDERNRTVLTYVKDTPRIRSNQSSTPCSFPSVSDRMISTDVLKSSLSN